MGKSFDLASVNFETLKHNGYDEKLIDALENENFEYLERADIKALCRDRDFVEPLIYACINSRKVEMYQIYAHLDDRMQSQLLSDYNVSCNILINAPEVIKDTPLAEDRNAILANVNDNPDIVEYMADNLINDKQFIEELSQKDTAVIKEMIEKYPPEKLIEANPELVNNPQFMAEAIAENVEMIKYVDKEMLNNYDVFEISAKENDKVAEYVLEHIQEFGDNAVKGVKDGSTESLRMDTIEILKELQDKYGRDGKIEREIEWHESHEREGNYELKVKSLIQIIKGHRWIRLDENELNKILNIVELDKELIERQLKENPEVIISQEQFMTLTTPDELKQIVEKSQIEDKEVFAERLKKYKEFYTMAKKSVSKEKTPKEKEEVIHETQEEKDDRVRAEKEIYIATNHFKTARKYMEKLQMKFQENPDYTLSEKDKIYPPDKLEVFLRGSEFKDDKDAIEWLEGYTKFYEKVQEKINGKTQEHNAEISINAITILVNDKGIEKAVTYDHTMAEGVQLTPEQMKQLEADLAARNTRENVQIVESPKRGITALRAEQETEKTGPAR